jgi:hypothetical protein
MSGVDVSLGGCARRHSESGVVPPSTTDNLQNGKPLILASLSQKHRLTKAMVIFDKLL